MQIPLFVYGTLRPAHRLYGLIERDVITSKPAELHGARLYVPEGFWFPVIVSTDNLDDVVLGDLLLCRDAEALREVIKMEIAVGYRMKASNVWCDDIMVRATCFTYAKVPEGSTQIIGGDWTNWENANVTLDM